MVSFPAVDVLAMYHLDSYVDVVKSRYLYIQALTAMQAANEYTDGLSYFQLAGE